MPRRLATPPVAFLLLIVAFSVGVVMLERVFWRECQNTRSLLEEQHTRLLSESASTARGDRLLAWERARSNVGTRLWLKTGFAIAFWLLGLCTVALAYAEQSRRRRYLTLQADFIATVSHELRTPLAAVRVLAETLDARVQGLPAARDYPSRIVAEVDQLSRLVENILSFNRIDKSRWTPRLQHFRLADVVRAEAELCAKGPFELEAVGFDEIALQADGELLQLLFANLTRNACRYNTRSPIRIRLEASAGGTVHVRFTDNRVGIPPEERSRVFEEFYRGTAGRGSHGTGLGLSLSRRIAELHHGQLRLSHTGPEGTQFELVLPGGPA